METFFIQDPDSVCFHSKGLKTDKLPTHLFEIDEDAKDEVSRGASECEWSAIDPLDRLHRFDHKAFSDVQ